MFGVCILLDFNDWHVVLVATWCLVRVCKKQADIRVVRLTLKLPEGIKLRVASMQETAIVRKKVELFFSLPMLKSCAEKCKSATSSSDYFVPVRPAFTTTTVSKLVSF